MDMDRKNMLERVVKAARKAYMKGFAAGSGGNVSIRIQGQVYISPSGICLGDLTQEDMIMLEADGVAPPADIIIILALVQIIVFFVKGIKPLLLFDRFFLIVPGSRFYNVDNRIFQCKVIYICI